MRWDRHKLLWDGNGTDKYVPWTTLVIKLIDSVLDILRQNRSNCENVFIKYLTKLRMNVKNMMLHYRFPEDAKVKF